MAKSPTEKYSHVTAEIMSDARFNPLAFASDMMHSHTVINQTFFKTVSCYIELLSKYAKSGLSPAGMSHIAHASVELHKVLEEYGLNDAHLPRAAEFEQIVPER